MAASADSPKPDFLIRLDGADVKPWLVPMRALSRVLAAVQRLVDQRDDLADDQEETGDFLDTETRTLRLLAVKAGSAAYAVTSENRQVTLGVLRETGQSLDAPEKALWHPSAVSSIDDLSQIAKQLGCVIEFREHKEGKRFGDVIAMIRPESIRTVQQRAFTHGRTSVRGKLERIGGATEAKCAIRVPGRHRLLFCRVASLDLTRELGPHIYSDVVLTGEAVWYRFNNQLKSLNVSSFSPAKTKSFADVAMEVRAAGGNAWDEILDPDAFIREMRS
jgi:hypothetical protein